MPVVIQFDEEEELEGREERKSNLSEVFEVCGGEDEEMVSLQSLSDLTGFPVEMLKNELLLGNKVSADNKISIEDLRKAMCAYLDSTMMEKDNLS